MKTIDKILNSYGINKEFIHDLEKNGISNGCGGKGGFNFSNFLDKLSKNKYFKFKKLLSLKEDLRLVCGIHDFQYFNGGNFIDFICYNFQLANNVQKITHWSGYIRRILTFLSVFLGTTIFGWHYFTNNKNMKNTELEILEGGAILDENTTSENDFLLGKIEEKTLNDYLKNVKPDNPKIFYNQGALYRTRNACTLFGSFGAVSDLTGYKFSEKEILEICDIAERDYGWREDYGGYIYKAVDCVRNYWNNKFPEKKLVSFRIDLKSQEDLDLIVKLYNAKKTLIIGYRTTREHYKDSQDNGILDSNCFVSCGAKVLGGHCIRYNHGMNIDNYIDRKKHNSYVNEKLVKLAKEGTYFPSAYVFFYKEDFKKIFEDVVEGSPFYAAIKWAKENGIIHGYDDGTFRPNDKISRGELMLVLYNYDSYLKQRLGE